MKVRTFLLQACFLVFLYPASVDGNSVNYSFVLLPLALALIRGRCRRPSNLLLGFVAFYVFIYLLASVYQYELYDEVERRAISFLLFMSLFSYMFIEIDAEMIAAFKVSLVVISSLFSLWAIATFANSGVAALDLEDAKNEVGSQRFGFVYLLALGALYLHPVRGFMYRVAKILACFVLVIGLALTFSRAAIIGCLVSLLGYMLWSLRYAFRRPARMLPRLIAVVAAVAVAVFLIMKFLPIVSDFFNQRLVALLTDPDAVESTLSTPGTSGGERIYIWIQIIRYLDYNILTGSGDVDWWSHTLLGGTAVTSH